MEERKDIKLKGYIGKWYAIDETLYNGEHYYLMEHCTYGDETFALVIDSNNEVICETYDDIITALEESL